MLLKSLRDQLRDSFCPAGSERSVSELVSADGNQLNAQPALPQRLKMLSLKVQRLQQRNRKQRTEGERRSLQDANREIRKSRVNRMAAIVEQLVDRVGGPNAFAKRWWELYHDGSVSFRRRCLETVMAMSLASDRWKTKEREFQIARLKAGEIEGDDCKDLSRQSDDELLDAMAGPLRTLVQYDLLHQVLRRMRRRGELEGERLTIVRDALR